MDVDSALQEVAWSSTMRPAANAGVHYYGSYVNKLLTTILLGKVAAKAQIGLVRHATF